MASEVRQSSAFRAARDVQHLFDGRRAVGLAQARQEALFSQRRGNLPKRIASVQRLRGGDSVPGAISISDRFRATVFAPCPDVELLL